MLNINVIDIVIDRSESAALASNISSTEYNAVPLYSTFNLEGN